MYNSVALVFRRRFSRSTAHVPPKIFPKLKPPTLVKSKQVSILAKFIPTAFYYGLASTFCVTYFVDWRSVMDLVVPHLLNKETTNVGIDSQETLTDD